MEFINVALPKGRLGEKVYAMFEQSGYECPSIKETNRKLIFENEEVGVRNRREGELGAMKLADLMKKMQFEVANKII